MHRTAPPTQASNLCSVHSVSNRTRNVAWLACTVAFALSLSGCKLLRKGRDQSARDREKPTAIEDQSENQPILLEGEVRYFDRQYDCVVIEYKRGPIPKRGTPLVVIRNGIVIGKLQASDLAGGRKAIADVIEGQVASGDTVRPAP